MVEGVGFGGGFVGAEAEDPGEAEGDAGFVAWGALGGVEADLQDEGFFDFADILFK